MDDEKQPNRYLAKKAFDFCIAESDPATETIQAISKIIDGNASITENDIRIIYAWFNAKYEPERYFIVSERS